VSKIFVSHSRRDREARAFISTAAARTSVKLALMESGDTYPIPDAIAPINQVCGVVKARLLCR
jgi:hypothetical protein